MQEKPGTKRPGSILIIDDDDDLFRFCQQFLPGTYHLMHARTGKEGLRILKTHAVALIILDKAFDRIDKKELFSNDAENEGLHLLRILRRQYAQLPVMMITAHADAASQRQALALGALDYLSWEALCGNVDYLKTRTENIFAQPSGF